MKQWLRQHPEHVPSGLDPPLASSHQLRSALLKKGWQVQQTADEVRLMMPGTPPSDAVIDSVLGDTAEDGSADEEIAAFGLESQLRDFLAQNLGHVPIGGSRLSL